MRTLILQRHAKSDYPLGVPDHDRPLSDRGRRDAPEAGRWIADHVGRPDLVLVSTATRAQQTWQLMEPSVAGVTTRDEPRIYEAGVGELLRVIQEVDDEVETLVIVGHNPGLEDLAGFLVTRGTAEARRSMGEKFPTSAIAVMTAESSWNQFGDAELSAFVVPRG